MAKRAITGKDKKTKKKPELPPIRCKGCPISFVPQDRRQHFHSETCREEYYQRTYYSKAFVRKVCPNCDTEFPTTKPGRQIYCAPACRDEARMKRREGLVASLTAERKTFLSDRFATLEKDDFKCTCCGKGAHDGVKLDVEEDGKGGMYTVCNMCKEGREFNDSVHSAEV